MSSLLLAAIPIDMNLLETIPDAPVSITADGLQITITEDEINFNTMGLVFEMTPDLDLYDAGLDSFLTISNLRLEQESVVLPAPDAFGMLLSSMIALVVLKRPKSVRNALRINVR